MSKLIPVLHRLEIECWIWVFMSSSWVSLIAMGVTPWPLSEWSRDCGNACGTLVKSNIHIISLKKVKKHLQMVNIHSRI